MQRCNLLIVRLAKVVGLTENEQIRIRGLIACTELIKMKLVLSQQIKTKVLPALKHILSKRPSAAVCMCTLGTLEACATSMGPESSPRDVLPIAVTLCNMEGLSRKQFDTVMTYLRKMLTEVEEYRHRLFAKGGANKVSSTGKGVFDKVPLPQLHPDSSGLAHATTLNPSIPAVQPAQQNPSPIPVSNSTGLSTGVESFVSRPSRENEHRNQRETISTATLAGPKMQNQRTARRTDGDDPFLLFQQAGDNEYLGTRGISQPKSYEVINGSTNEPFRPTAAGGQPLRPMQMRSSIGQASEAPESLGRMRSVGSTTRNNSANATSFDDPFAGLSMLDGSGSSTLKPKPTGRGTDTSGFDFLSG